MDSLLVRGDSEVRLLDSLLVHHDSEVRLLYSLLVRGDSEVRLLDSLLVRGDSEVRLLDSLLVRGDSEVLLVDSLLVRGDSEVRLLDCLLVHHDSEVRLLDSLLVHHDSEVRLLDSLLVHHDSEVQQSEHVHVLPLAFSHLLAPFSTVEFLFEGSLLLAVDEAYTPPAVFELPPEAWMNGPILLPIQAFGWVHTAKDALAELVASVPPHSDQTKEPRSRVGMPRIPESVAPETEELVEVQEGRCSMGPRAAEGP